MNGEHILHNNKKWRQKAGRLKDEGAFRVPTDRKTWARTDAPKFAGKVLQVDGLKGSHVDSGDKSFPVKQCLLYQLGRLMWMWMILVPVKAEGQNKQKSWGLCERFAPINS